MQGSIMEKEMQEQEKRLQWLLIRKFIVTLIVVGIVEFIITTVSDRFVMPVMAEAFFKDHEMSEAFSTVAVTRYVLEIFLGAVMGFMIRFLPLPLRIPAGSYIDRLIEGGESRFFASGQNGIIAQLPLREKITITLMILGISLILAVPYIVAAVRFTIVTMREFKKIASLRMQARKDYERRRNLMIADIAHDLRTPITTVSGYAQALADGLVKDEDEQAYLEAICAKSRGMNDLIQLLFDYTRLDSEGFKLKKEKTDICEMVRECAAGLYTDAESAGMGMDVDIPDKSIFLDLDRAQFKRVINNIMINAIRHNDKGCDIGISVCEDGNRLNITIADKGKPVPEDMAVHIFEPFFMGDASRNSRGGSGLGLSVAKKITDMHGFKLRLLQGSDINKIRGIGDYSKAFVISMGL